MGSATDYNGCCELEKSILAIVEPFDTHRCPTIFAFFKPTSGTFPEGWPKPFFAF
jgi:hypothetical protein